VAKWGAILKAGRSLLRNLQVHYGGEDAYFISEACGGAMGVADGVGGWQETGVNPAGMFSHFSCL
jgi:hypothetical protein